MQSPLLDHLAKAVKVSWHDELTLQEFGSRTLILADRGHACLHVSDYARTQAQIALRAVVEDGGGKIDDSQRIMDQLKAVDECLGSASLDALKMILAVSVVLVCMARE